MIFIKEDIFNNSLPQLVFMKRLFSRYLGRQPESFEDFWITRKPEWSKAPTQFFRDILSKVDIQV